MKTQEITLPDGSIGIFRADQSDEEIKSIIQKDFPDAYPKTEQPSTWRQLEYGFASARTDIGNLGDILESYIPTGQFFNPTETYGEEFMRMNPEQRRKFLYDRRQAMIEKEYADVIAANQQDTLSANVGNFVGSIFSPTTIIPVGHGYKAVAATSAILGAEYDALDQFMKKGEVDPTQTAVVAGTAGVLGPATIFAGRRVKDVYNSLRRKKGTATPADVKEAEAVADQVNDLVYKARSEGVADDAIPQYIKDNSGLDPQDIAASFIVSDVRPIIPTLGEIKVVNELSENGLDVAARVKSGVLRDLWQPIADRIEAASPRLAVRLRKVDLQSHMKANQRAELAKPFAKAYKKLSRADRRVMKKYLLNGDFNAANKLFAKVPNGQEAFKGVRGVLKEIHQDLVKSGYKDLTELPNYFPRRVVDLKALRKSLGVEAENLFKRAVSKRKKQLGIKAKGKLPDAEEQRILNEVARGIRPVSDGVGGFGPGQKRILESIRDDQLDLYADPLDGLQSYIRSATNNAEKRRFFGGAGVHSAEGIIDLENSVGNIIKTELKDIDPDDAQVIGEMLKARFVTGEVAPNKIIQSFRNLTYLAKLANPFSAVTQLHDLSTSVWVNGVGNTLASILGPGTRRATMQKFGLDDVLAEEFTNEKVLARTLHAFFTASGFRNIDKFGKNVFINSTLRRMERLARTPAGVKKLAEKHGKEFGDEFTSLVTNLKNGEITDNVKLLLWNELAKVQPISLSEMPLKYLESPNGRVAYALKTFAAKQISNTLRRTKGEWDKGNKKEAVKNLATWAVTVPTAGIGVAELKDKMRYLGQEMPYSDPSTWTEAAIEYGDNALKMFGASSYLVSKLAEGNVDAALGGINFFAPGLSTIESVMQMFSDLEAGEPVDKRVLKEIPLVGQAYYYWLGGGIEEDYNRAIKKEIRKRSER